MKPATVMMDIIHGLCSKPATERYPFEREPAPERLRGLLYWNPEYCTGCGLCVKDCPADALELITIDQEAKRFVLRYHMDRCTFCAQCVQNCHFGCLEMSSVEWELAATSKKDFVVCYGDNADVESLLQRFSSLTPEPTQAK